MSFTTLWGQESSEKKKGRPDLPGTFSLELGVNRPLNKPKAFDIGLWGSRTLNVTYQLDKRIGQSKFSVHPGVGFGFERYKLRNGYTLFYADTTGAELDLTKNTNLLLANSGLVLTNPAGKSMLIVNYFDLMAELRFSTNPEDPGRSFKISIGGKIGARMTSQTKVKYRDSGAVVQKTKNDFDLNDFRYGAFVKVGAGSFSVFAHYNFSPLFTPGVGPEKTDMNNLTIGVSLASF